MGRKYEVFRRRTSRVRSQHRAYDCCAARRYPAQDRTFSILLHLRGMAFLFEPSARAAGKYIEHDKLLAPTWTAGCELALLFPEMKVAAPRFVTHYFTNAGNPEEGILRHQAQAFVEGNKSGNLQRLRQLEPKFRQV